MACYRKKPATVEAIQWFKGMQHPYVCTDPVGGPYGDRTYGVMTPNGFVPIESGEWIIVGVKGELYPCKPEIFSELYELEEFDPGFDNCN